MMSISLNKALTPAWLVAGMGWVARFVAMGTSFWILRLNLSALGPDRFSVLALLIGVGAWFALGDLGLGTWLQNTISHGRAHGRDTTSVERETITVIVVIMVVLGALAWLLAPWLSDWLLGNFHFLTPVERIRLWKIAFILQFGGALGQVYTKVLFSRMQGVHAHLIAIVVNLLTAGLVLIILRNSRVEVSSLVFAALLPAALMAIVNWAIYLKCQLAWPEWPDLKKRISTAFGFFRFFFLGTLTLNCDLIIAARFLPHAEMTSYSVAFRVFNVVMVLYGSILSAIWPHCSEAYALHDFVKIRKLLHQMIWIGLIGVVCFTLVMVVGAPYIIRILSPREAVMLPWTLLVSMGGVLLVRVWSDAHAVVLQSCNAVSPLFYYNAVQAIVSVALQFLLVNLFGVVGIPLGIGLSFLFTVAWGLPVLIRRMVMVSSKCVQLGTV